MPTALSTSSSLGSHGDRLCNRSENWSHSSKAGDVAALQKLLENGDESSPDATESGNKRDENGGGNAEQDDYDDESVEAYTPPVKKISGAKLKYMLKMLASEAGFLVNGSVQQALDNLPDDEAELVKADMIMRALESTTKRTWRTTGESETGKKNSKRTSSTSLKAKARKAEKEYWQNIVKVFPAQKIRTMATLEMGLTHYNTALLRRKELIDDVTAMKTQNAELKNLLKQEGAYLALVFICTALSIVGLALMYMRYAECELNVIFISITLLSVVILTALSVVAWVNVGLLPSTAVSLYLVFLCYQTVRANPSASCASLHVSTEKKMQEQSGVIMNSFVAAFTVTWTSWRTSATSTVFFSSSSTKKQSEDDEELASIGLTSARLDKEGQREVEVVPEYQFHVLMPKVSCVNHAAIVEGYYMGKLSLREGSLQIPLTAFIRLACANTSVEKSTAAARRQRKRETAARRRAERLEELTAQGKFVPLSDRVRNALQHAYDRFGGARFVLRDFLPSFQEGTGALPDVLNSLQEMPSTEVLDDGNVHHNRTDYLQVATVSGAQVVLPAGSSFAQRDVRTLHQLALGRHKLILMDPPWQNKSVSRGKRYDMLDHSELLKIHVPHIADPDECILAVWVTNRPRYMAYLREQALPSWGFTYHTCWYWLKLSKNGELVTPLDSTHRLPVETLAVAYRAKDQAHEQTLRQRLGEQMRIVLSIPLRHSWKPPLECFFDKDIMSTTHRKVELFARELRPHWTSVGNEVSL
ncbi:Dynein regulatory complex protein 1, C-terminal [Phytophthora cactorum]|nr:Dynein regulatory complex protein 1, C-terminal [Phytophthora cactorum]